MLAFVAFFLLADECVFPQSEGSFLWTYKATDLLYAPPSIAQDGTIYVAAPINLDGPSKLVALTPKGEKKWDLEIEGATFASPAIGADGTIYLGTSSIQPSAVHGKLHAISPHGTNVWTFTPPFIGGEFPHLASRPAIGEDGTIYVAGWGGSKGRLFAISSVGTQKWAFATADRAYSPPAIGQDGTVYFGSLDFKMYAFHPDGSMAGGL